MHEVIKWIVRKKMGSDGARERVSEIVKVDKAEG